MPKNLGELFQTVFDGYVYPAKSADEVINELTEDERVEYFQAAKKLVESEVLRQELDSLQRDVITKIALEASPRNALDVAYYRGAALFSRLFLERLHYLEAHADAHQHMLRPVEELSPYLGKTD